MATRVNIKLLVIVTVASVFTVGVVGAVVAMKYKNDPTRHIRQGDAFMAAGNYSKAADSYGRAIGKRQNNLEYHTKFLEASAKIVPNSPSEAQERYGRYVASLMKRASIARTDQALWRSAFRELRAQAELIDSASMWQVIKDRIDNDVLGSVSPDDPLVPVAKAFRSFAQARRLQGLAPEEVAAAHKELESILTLVKGEDLDLAYGGLLLIKINAAQKLSAVGQNQQSADAWKAVDELLARALKDVPDGPQVLKAQLDRERVRRALGDPAAKVETAIAASDHLADVAVASDDGYIVHDAWRAIAQNSGLPDALARSTAPLKRYLEKHSEAIIQRRDLASCLQYLDPAAAEVEARKVLDSKTLPISLDGASQDQVKSLSALQIFDLRFAQLNDAKDDAARTAGLKALEDARLEVAERSKGTSDDSPVVKADGKSAFARGDFATASMKFNELLKRGGHVDAELYVLLAATAEQLDQLGLAAQFVRKGLELAPGNVDLMERAGMLEFRMAHWEETIRYLGPVVTADPKRAHAKELLDLALRNRAGSGQLDPNDPLVQAIVSAQKAFDAKNYDAARAIIDPLLAKNPTNLALIRVKVIIEAVAGDKKTALEWCDRGLAIDPKDGDLLRRKVFLGSDDPTERVKIAVAEHYPKDPDLSVWMYIRIANLLASTDEQIAQVKDSNPKEAARLAATLPHMKDELAAAKAKAEALDLKHPALHDWRFTKALEAKDWTAAQAVIAEVEDAKRDPTLPSMLKARLAIAQQKPGLALELLQQALDRNIDTPSLWLMMGYAHEQMGNMAQATKAYGEAYRREPTDMQNTRAFASALSKTGDIDQALVILREARKVARDTDEDILDKWLELEYKIGDRRQARGMRESRYQLVPTDTPNAKALAAMLSELQPEREDVADARGAAKYNDVQWRTLAPETRVKELNLVREVWRQESDRIFNELTAADPAGVELAVLRATALRRQARYADAEKALKDVISRAGDKATAAMYVAIGLHYAEVGELPKATAMFGEAEKRQSDAKREANATIGEYWFQKFHWEQAAEHLEKVAVKVKDPTVSLRLAEIYGNLNKFDQARAKLAEATAGGKHDVVVDQLEANIAEREGNLLREQGKKDEAIKALNRATAALDRAANGQPNNPVIAVQQASVLRRQFDTTGDKTQLAAALAAADRATKLRADFWPAARAKSELLLAQGDVKASVNEVERFIKAAPMNTDGRQRLIEMHVAMGNNGRAMEVARDAIGIAPNDPRWHALLGDVQFTSGQLDEAILSYEQADKLRPDPFVLLRLTQYRMQRQPVEWEKVLTSLRERTTEVGESPVLQAAIGAALYGSGEQKKGLETLRSSYRFARDKIAKKELPAGVLDMWYAVFRLIFTPARAAEAEKFVVEMTDGKLDAYDQRWLGGLWVASGPDGGSHAIELIEKAIASDQFAAHGKGTDPAFTASLHDIAGSIRYSQGDCAGSLAHFVKAVELQPNEPSLLNNFAYLAAECGGELPKALEAAQKAVTIVPAKADYVDTLGYVKWKSGDKDGAKLCFSNSVRLANTASAQVHWAQILLEEGHKEEAKTHLREAGDLKPDAATQKQINDLIEKCR